MFKSIIAYWVALLIFVAMLAGCSNSVKNIPYHTLTDIQKTITNISYRNDFDSIAQSVVLGDGKSILQSELFYTKTGTNSYSEAYGNMQSTFEYTIYNKDGEIKKTSSLYISSNLSEIKLPDKIKYTDNFLGTLDALNLTEKVRNRDDERYFNVKNDDKSEISISFLSFHTEPVNIDFLEAYATVSFIDNIEEKDEKDRVHNYHKSINLTFREGKLVSIHCYVLDKYESPDEEKINNNKVGIRFNNPEYKGDTFKTKLEELYYEDGKINTIYSVKASNEVDINVSYEGMQSADNGILYERLTHKVNGEMRLTDSISEPFADSYKPSWYENLYKNYLFFEIGLPYNNF
ncbi:MAG: hypothetical protein PHV95_00675 [Eubacteriales bacterium]|nr:hypothetical protein [Eubacteriales bacterium]